ncbi:MAG: nicotinate (nicotinamide) nucleotide adenylyltransferase, partial [Desulfamplus sp.]|nr:nicotinate (nicotinamide) nucleotide adenylyltransferase [Desulfamplus sp.]
MNIGLFGGTFNPVHNGHIRVTSHVKEVFKLDVVYMIPSAIPPHKSTANLAPAMDRFNMLETAVKTIDGIEASDIEVKRSGRSFTIDTIRRFKDIYPCPDKMFFILGTDAFFDMGTWKETLNVFQTTEIIVMTRPGYEAPSKGVELFLQETVSPGYRYAGKTIHGQIYKHSGTTGDCSPCPARYKHSGITGDCSPCPARYKHSGITGDCSPYPARFRSVHLCKVPDIPVSSTGIRNRIERGISIKDIVPESVAAIIMKKGLYFDNGKQT